MAKQKKSAKLFIHAGFMKTATTTLQDEIFAKHSQLYNIGNPYSKKSADHNFIEDISKKQILDYNQQEATQGFKNIQKKNTADKNVILSQEIFTSGYADRAVIAERLHQLAPDAQIIFTIREPLSCLKSFFLFELKKSAKKMPVLDFTKWLKIKHSETSGLFQQLDYYPVIAEYQRLFGKENVHVLAYEEIRKSSESFFAELSSILEIDNAETMQLYKQAEGLNKGITWPEFAIIAFNKYCVPTGLKIMIKSFFPKTLRSKLADILGSAKKYDVDFPPEWKTKIENIYAENNSKIAKEFKLDLASYGYKLK